MLPIACHRGVYDSMLIVGEITSKDQFEGLQVMWNVLLEESETYSPFLTHDWFKCCLAGYSKEKEIFILIVRDESTVIGIAPLWRFQDVIRGIQVRKIGFITSPDTPFVDLIIQKERRQEILKAILYYLYR